MYLRGKRYENEKNLIKNEKGNNQYTKEVIRQKDDKPKFKSTSEKLGREYGVSETMIQRDGNFAGRK